MATSLNALSLIIGMNTDRVTAGVASIRQQMGRASRIFQSMKTDSDRLTEGTKALSVAFANGSISSQKMTEGLKFLEQRYGATAKAARESEEVDKRVQKLVAQSRPAVKGLVDDMRLLIKAKQDGKVTTEEFAHAQAMLKARMAELKAEESGAAEAARKAAAQFAGVQKTVEASIPQSTRLAMQIRNLRKEYAAGNISAAEFARTNKRLRGEYSASTDAGKAAAAAQQRVQRMVAATVPDSTRLAMQIRELRREYVAGNITAEQFVRTKRMLKEQLFQVRSAAEQTGNSMAIARRKFDEWKQSVRGANAELPGFVSGLGAAAAALLSIQGIKSLFGASLEIERATLAFEVYTGSAARAAQMVKDLQRLDRESPLGALEVNRAAEMMLAYGINTEKVIPTLRMLGDVAGGSSERFGRLSYAMSQILNLGRLTGTELRQLVEAGFNPLEIMTRKLGKSQDEMRKQMEAGAVSAEMVLDALVQTTSKGGVHAGFMEKYAQSTSGAISRLRSTALLFAADFGRMFLPAIAAGAKFLAGLMDVMTRLAGSMNKTTKMFAGGTAAFVTFIMVVPRVVAAFKAIASSVRSLIAIQITLQAFSGPKGWAVIAAGMAVAAAAVWSVDSAISSYEGSLADATAANEQFTSTSVTQFDYMASSVKGTMESLAEELKQQQEGGFFTTLLTELNPFLSALSSFSMWSEYNKGAEEAKKITDEVAGSAKTFAEMDWGTEKASNSVATLIQRYAEANLELTMGAEWAERYRAELDGGTEAQLKQLKLLQERNAMLQQAKELEEERQQAVEQRRKSQLAESKKYAEDLERDAERVRESVQTPFQAAAQSIARLMQLLQGGFITSAEYAKALTQEVAGMRNQQQAPAIAAIEKGSQEAYARMTGNMADRREAQLKKMEEQRLIAAAQLKAQQEANRLARNMTTVARIR